MFWSTYKNLRHKKITTELLLASELFVRESFFFFKQSKNDFKDLSNFFKKVKFSSK